MHDNDSIDDTVECRRKSAVSRRQFGALTLGAGVTSALSAVASAAASKEPAGSSVTSRNIHLHRQIIERGFSQGDLTVADEICAQNYQEHEYGAPTDLKGPEILKSEINVTRSALQNVSLTIEDVVASGDKVWARLMCRGKDPRSGKQVAMTVMDISRFEQGKLVEHWGVVDQFALFHQLGLLPKELGG